MEKYINIYIILLDKMNKVKVELDEDIVNQLIKRKKVGDTYSDIIRELLRVNSKNGEIISNESNKPIP